MFQSINRLLKSDRFYIMASIAGSIIMFAIFFVGPIGYITVKNWLPMKKEIMDIEEEIKRLKSQNDQLQKKINDLLGRKNKYVEICVESTLKKKKSSLNKYLGIDVIKDIYSLKESENLLKLKGKEYVVKGEMVLQGKPFAFIPQSKAADMLLSYLLIKIKKNGGFQKITDVKRNDEISDPLKRKEYIIVDFVTTIDCKPFLSQKEKRSHSK